MSSSAAIKVKKVSKDKQADATDSKNDDLQNAHDSREPAENKETKEAPQSKATKKGGKKATQAKEQEVASPEVAKESQGEQELAKKEEQKAVDQGKAAKKGKKQNKADDRVPDSDQANSQINTEASEKKKEVKKTEGDEDQSKPKKAGQKVEATTSKKPEVVVQADLTSKPKATEVKSPNPKTKEPAGPAKTEPHKIISVTELKKPEKEVPSAKPNPKSEALPSNRKDLHVDAENKKLQANPVNQKSVQSPKNPPVIDLSAVKHAAPQTTTSPKPTIEKSKVQNQKPANVPVSPATTENRPPEGLKTAQNKVTSPKNPLKEANVPAKDVKSPRNAKSPVVETKKVEENPKNLTKKPTVVLEKQKTIPQNDKSVNVKSGNKPEPIRSRVQSRVYTEGDEKVKPTSATMRTAAKSPQTYRQTESTGKNPVEDKNKANKAAPQSEKPRMRSFDAGKTDKINPEDPFEVRNKMWQIRKQERLLQEEKKKLRKDTQECTFSPQLNQKSLSKQLSPYDIYERGVEWNEKVQAARTEQAEKHLEELRKPIITKARVKSDAFVSEPRRSTLEGFSGPQFGTSRGMGVPAYSHEPLEYKTNLESQITEIRDIFDNITSALKAKAAKQSGTYRTPEPQSTPRTKTEETKKTEVASSSQFKPKSPALEKEDANRIDSLKGILNLKQDAKKLKGKEQSKKVKVEEGNDFFISEAFKPEELVKNPRQIEIRNNRYVMIDHNLSSIEKKDTVDSNDVSLNFESTEAK